MGGPIIGITTDTEGKPRSTALHPCPVRYKLANGVERGKYLKVKNCYPDAIAKAGGIPFLIPLSGSTAFYAERIDGLLIPGGEDLAPFYYKEPITSNVRVVSRKRSDFEFSLLKEVISLRKPVLGICYGMQLINVAFGGTLHQDIESQVSVEINHKKGYHIIVISENRFLKKGRFSVNSTHHQAIKRLGIGLLAFAYSADNLIEAYYKEGYPFLVGVQWHPERLIDNELSLSLFKSFVEASSDNK